MRNDEPLRHRLAAIAIAVGLAFGAPAQADPVLADPPLAHPATSQPAGDAAGDAAGEAAALLGSWCDATGYQLNLTPQAIWFRDVQAEEDPPPGSDLAFGGNIAVYTQDFSGSRYPLIGLLACSLTLTGPGRAREQCHGPGTGFRPIIDLERCPEMPIS